MRQRRQRRQHIKWGRPSNRRPQADRRHPLERLRALADALRAHLAAQHTQHPGQFTAEGLADAAADETDALLLDHLRAELARLEEMAGGAEHRTCLHCGRRIPKARREALPGVTTCVRCADLTVDPSVSGDT